MSNNVANRVSYVDLVELGILYFDVVLGIDWFHACFTSIDCRTRVARFNFPNEPVVEWKRKILILDFILSLA